MLTETERCATPGGLAHACYPNTREVEARRSGVQDYPWLHKKFEASPGYIRHCLKLLNPPKEAVTNWFRQR